MEIKGKISITKTSKGKTLINISWVNKKGKLKSQQIMGIAIPEEHNGKECIIEMESNKIIKIVIEGEEFVMKQNQKNKNAENNKDENMLNQSSFRKHQHRTSSKSEAKGTKCIAKAPFNFVPLNKKIIPAEGLPFQSKSSGFLEDRNSGYIECELETITPLFIGQGKDHYGESAKFFNVKSKVEIPGSSIRGMIRTLVQIVSWSKFKFFNNDRLYYRWIAENFKNFKNLREHYESKMSSEEFSNDGTKKRSYRFYAGYLEKEGFDYYIIPAKSSSGFINGFRMEKATGKMNNKKNYWVIAPKDDTSDKIPVPEEVIESYRNDKFRKIKNVDPLRRADKGEDAPCFYTVKVNKKGEKVVKSFGHTGFYRIPYDKTIRNFVTQEFIEQGDNAKTQYDIDEAIFGRVKGNEEDLDSFAGRVYFESAKLVPSEEKNIFWGECVPKILSTPKPTAFQLYLEQKRGQDLRHYDSDDTQIRGYKLYWHRWNNNDPHFWEESNLEFKKEIEKVFQKYGINIEEFDFIERNKKIYIKKRYSQIKDENLKKAIRGYLLLTNDSQYSIINPIKPKIKFRFRIRFENLTKRELGALLFVLDLPKEHYHKLGMGKPLGLGSVKISPKLYLIDRKKRYSKLFEGNNWNLMEKQEENIDSYKKDFEEYILENLGLDGTFGRLWDVERMQQLKTLLDWGNTKLKNWIKRTEYMPRGEFKERCILPTPKEVVENTHNA